MKKMMLSSAVKKNKSLLYLRLLTLTFVSVGVIANSVYGQITTSVTMSGTPISGSPFASFSAAITAVNALSITGPVIVSLPAGGTETLSGKITLTATGTSANPITIQKSGSGANPVLTAYAGTVSTPSVIADGFFVIAGGDYITIDGLNLQESAANTTATTVMEFGFGLFKASAANGCQYNTIKNCTITLNRLQNTAWTAPGHNGSCGIAVLNGLHNATGVLTVTAASGSNSFNKFQNNTIQNCNVGIAFVAYDATAGVGPNPNPATFLGDLGNEVGGSSTTGNSILNFGGATGATNPAHGIFANSQWSMRVTHNTLNNNNGSGVNHVNTLRGMFFNSSSTSANLTCTNNTITVKSGATTSALLGIESNFGGTPAGNKINISDNTITLEYLTATSGTVDAIFHQTNALDTLWIANNVINPIAYSSSALAGSGAINGIRNTTAANYVFMLNNKVLGINRTGTTGATTIGIVNTGTAANQILKNNLVRDISISGSGTASIIYGIQSATGTVVVDSNTVKNLSVQKSTGTGALYGIYNIASPTDENINYNIVDTLIHLGTGTTYGIFFNTVTGTRTLSNNRISNIVSIGNTVGGILSTTSSPNIFNNRIWNVTSFSNATAAVSFGIRVSTVGTGGIANLYNNIISNISAPFSTNVNGVIGIDISGTAIPANIYYNTIKLDTAGNALTSTSTTNFGGTGIHLNSSASVFNVLNNYIKVNGTPVGNGTFAALRRAGVAGSVNTPPSNITMASNIYYTNSHSNNFLYVEGTTLPAGFAAAADIRNGFATNGVTNNPTNNIVLDPNFNTGCSLFKTWIPCNNCFTEDSLVATTPIGSFVPTAFSFAQNAGSPITVPNINFDNKNTVRSNTFPDIGALEFAGASGQDVSAPVITYTDVPNLNCIQTPTISATIVDVSGINTTTFKPRLYYKFSGNANDSVANSGSANGWKWVESNSTSNPFTFTFDFAKLNATVANDSTIQYFIVAQDLASTPNVANNTVTFNSGFCPNSVVIRQAGFPVSGVKDFKVMPAPSIFLTAKPNPVCYLNNDTLSIGYW